MDLFNRLYQWLSQKLVGKIILVDSKGDIFKATLKQTYPITLGNLLKGNINRPTIYTDHEWIQKRIQRQRKQQNLN